MGAYNDIICDAALANAIIPVHVKDKYDKCADIREYSSSHHNQKPLNGASA